MFVAPCFIRNNSAELREYLKQIGYKPFGKILDNTEFDWIYCCRNKFKTINPSWNHNHSFETNSKYIDCGKNKNLFKYISALRDDCDMHQLFYSSFYDTYILFEEEEISFDRVRNCYIYLGEPIHKCTKEEIIKYTSKDD